MLNLLNKKKPNHVMKHRNYMIFCVMSILIVILGACLFLFGIYHYSKATFAYKTISANEWSNKASTSNASEIEENSTGTNISKKAYFDQYFSYIKKGQDLYPIRPETGDYIGKLYIPALNAELPIYQGTKEDELEKGVGHFSGSVLPGENDNCVLSGHRDTVFRKLGNVEKGDLLIVRTSAGEFKYRVSKIRIVDADDRTVIVSKPRATLTVSTCYPFHYIGPAPKRYILEAYLADKTIY